MFFISLHQLAGVIFKDMSFICNVPYAQILSKERNGVMCRIIWSILKTMSLSHRLHSRTKNQNVGSGVRAAIFFMSIFNDSYAVQG